MLINYKVSLKGAVLFLALAFPLKQANAAKEISSDLTYFGTVISRSFSNVASDVEGLVVSRLEEGSVVEKDTVIARLDTKRLEIERKRILAKIKQKTKQLAHDELQVQRIQMLNGSNAISADKLDQAVLKKELSQEALDIAKHDLEVVSLDIERSTIRAQISGVVAQSFVQVGEYVQRGTALSKIVDPNYIEVTMRVSGEQSANVPVNSSVTIRTNSRQGIGTIRSHIPSSNIDNPHTEMRVEVVSGEFTPGEMVKVIATTHLAQRDKT
ncbi:efflux RND transporter periplasmic adaptor subunit [Pseudoalteromonas sp. MTN2-4]|uniref:efflux RND transporter periplasmic adaptor subunit n=1 Tax=Pseudoalteromonas sp. MTN2-4 TaxID=3056555 RepID=UPI0036F2868B